MSVKTHILKTWPSFFEDVMSGIKTFEVRRFDRDFNIGDVLELHEYSSETGHTGRAHRVVITYMMSLNEVFKGGNSEYVILGIEPKKPVPLAEQEKKAILGAIRALGSVALAAEALEIGRATIYRRLADYGHDASSICEQD